MIKILFVLFVTLSFLKAEESFLSDLEYAKKLYHNPRGISCAQCHGERGEGSTLSAYVIELNGKKKLRDIKAPAINNIKMFDFLKAFESKREFMPTYYLTDKELAYIYFYITRFGKKESKKDSIKSVKLQNDKNETKKIDDIKVKEIDTTKTTKTTNPKENNESKKK